MAVVLDVLGPRLEHLTDLSEDMGYCLMKGEVGPGVFVPLHRHEDRETFYIVSGELEVWDGDEWKLLKAGDTADVPGNQKHSWRNLSGETATLLIVSTVKMGEFFNEVGQPVDSVPPGPPQPEALQKFMEVAISYGYWLGTPEENAAIGLSMG